MPRVRIFALCVAPFFWLLPILLAFAPGQDDEAYRREIQAWDEARVKSLKSETGWLNLAGLYWLKEGDNTFGSGADNDLVFPAGKAAESLGVLTLKDSVVSMRIVTGEKVIVDNHDFQSGVIFKAGEERQLTFSYRSLRWFIIKRGPKIGVRLRDLESPALAQFSGIPRYPANPAWRVQATLAAPERPAKIPIRDVLGLTTPTPLAGTLHFQIKGKAYSLQALDEGEELFIIFSDATTNNTTYGGGRFLYAKKPAQGDKIVLDFNKAYNPPCAFTEYATCPLPPVANKLGLKVEAGEKKVAKEE